jgi:RNA polymerase sigma factor (sigma-70 family)
LVVFHALRLNVRLVKFFQRFATGWRLSGWMTGKRELDMETGYSPATVITLGMQEEILPASHESQAKLSQDDDLIEGCKAGNMAAYEQLYRKHGTRMKSIALNLVGNTSDAEDAVQDVFLKIYRSADSFKRDAAFSTWIYRILINACYDLMRRRQRCKPETSASELGNCRTARQYRAKPLQCAHTPRTDRDVPGEAEHTRVSDEGEQQ